MFSMSSSKTIFLNKSLSVIHLFPDRKDVTFSNSAQQIHSTSLLKIQHFSHVHQLFMLVTFDRPLTFISKSELFKIAVGYLLPDHPLLVQNYMAEGPLEKKYHINTVSTYLVRLTT